MDAWERRYASLAVNLESAQKEIARLTALNAVMEQQKAQWTAEKANQEAVIQETLRAMDEKTTALEAEIHWLRNKHGDFSELVH